MTSSPPSLKQLFCIDFPGVVLSTENAIKCCGGLEHINNVFMGRERHLKLRFRPDGDGPIVNGDVIPCCNVLIKVRYHRRKNSKRKKPSIEICGIVTKVIRFFRMADFAYLPNGPTATVPPSFRPPVFSRIDIPMALTHRPLIPRPSRARVLAIGASDPVPIQPTDAIIRAAESVPLHIRRVLLPLLHAAFQLRPVWTRPALLRALPSHSAFAQTIETPLIAVRRISSFISPLLPVVSFEFRGGPWGRAHVRYGYDPRGDPAAGPLQVLVWRVPRNAPLGYRGTLLHRTPDVASSSDDAGVWPWESHPKTQHRTGPGDPTSRRPDSSPGDTGLSDDEETTDQPPSPAVRHPGALSAPCTSAGTHTAPSAIPTTPHPSPPDSAGPSPHPPQLVLRLWRVRRTPFELFAHARRSALREALADIADPVVEDVLAHVMRRYVPHGQHHTHGASLDPADPDTPASMAHSALPNQDISSDVPTPPPLDVPPTPSTPVCDPRTGWIPRSALNTIRARLNMLFLQWIAGRESEGLGAG